MALHPATDPRPPIIVTGGAGYIGSHTSKALSAAGFLPVALDNLERGHREFVRWGPIEVGPIQDKNFVESIFDKWRPVAVMHIAGLAYVNESIADPAAYFSTNVNGTIVLLDACRRGGVGHFIFSSSCAVYGRPATLPIAEDAAQQPLSPYGWSKLAAEKAIQAYGAAYGLRFAALRYFNAAGADPDGELWEWHDPETRLIPLALRAALGAGPELTLFGTDYPTKDGTCVRDYIHVGDLASGHVAALAYLQAGGESTAINLGSGVGTSNRAVLDAVATEVRSPVPVRVAARRPGDPAALVANIEQAARVLGWRPRRSDLPTIIRTAARRLRHGLADPMQDIAKPR